MSSFLSDEEEDDEEEGSAPAVDKYGIEYQDAATISTSSVLQTDSFQDDFESQGTFADAATRTRLSTSSMMQTDGDEPKAAARTRLSTSSLLQSDSFQGDVVEPQDDIARTRLSTASVFQTDRFQDGLEYEDTTARTSSSTSPLVQTESFRAVPFIPDLDLTMKGTHVAPVALDAVGSPSRRMQRFPPRSGGSFSGSGGGSGSATVSPATPATGGYARQRGVTRRSPSAGSPERPQNPVLAAQRAAAEHSRQNARLSASSSAAGSPGVVSSRAATGAVAAVTTIRDGPVGARVASLERGLNGSHQAFSDLKLVELYVARLVHAVQNGRDWEVEEILRLCPEALIQRDTVSSHCMILNDSSNWDDLLSAALTDELVAAGISHEDFFARCSVRDAHGNDVQLGSSVYQKSDLPLNLRYVHLDQDCGNTLLHYAASRGHARVATVLIAANADVNATNTAGDSVLHAACLGGDVDIIGLLLRSLAEVNAVNKHGRTALHRAAKVGHAEAVRLLASAKADLEARTGKVKTRIANHGSVDASQRHPWFTTDVLTHQSRFHAFGFSADHTALHIAAAAGHKDIVITLLFAGANVHAMNADGRTALHVAAVNNTQDLTGQWQMANVIVGLLSSRADLTLTDRYAQTPLHVAASVTCLSMTNLLLSADADVHAQAQGGQTALHVALNAQVLRVHTPDADKPTEGLIFGSTVDLTKLNWGPQSSVNPCEGIEDNDDLREVVVALLKARADPRRSDDGGSTPLHFAASNGFQSAVAVLLAANVKVNAKDASQWSALQWAAGCGHGGATVLLLEGAADVNTTDQHLWTPLHWTSSRGHKAEIRLLLDARAEVNSGDEQQLTSLHWAVSRGHCDVVDMLLAAFADINSKDERHLTSLHWAVGCGHCDIVTLLLGVRADLNTPASAGHVPLHFASTDSMVKILLEANADMRAEDVDGNIALEVAMRGGKKLVDM